MYGGEGAVLAAMGFLSFIWFVVFVVAYILKSLGISALAANRGFENPWLGWVPIADLYLLGMLVGSMDLFGIKVDKLEIILPAAMVGGFVLSWIPFIGQLLWLALTVFFIVFVYKLFEMYTSNAILYTALSILLCLLPIFLFIIRNNPPLLQPQNPNNQY
ncbi:hypothetical protein ASZ90_020144 [hydrocarbon metagenome]|uniref:Uncharacterized protein n=1 Tax=hydrocarbon metagenome TaxID=938273 RepID=A0A0W8E1I6_9ZZZZ